MTRPHIVLVDPKSGRGGGQVVLEELLDRLQDLADLSLVMPSAGRQSIEIPTGVRQYNDLGELNLTDNPRVTVVANANASFASVALWQRRQRNRPAAVRTVGIVHNYPSSVAKALATRVSLRALDVAIVVEPGLLRLRRDAIVPPWLSVRPRDLEQVPAPSGFTGRVKVFARPDPTKGLHLLPEIFKPLSEAGIKCEVALGQALDGHDRYVRHLRRSLAEWKVEGQKSVRWIHPGDIVLVPSISGEAVCLAAQESMVRNAFVVSSRLGVLPYLQPTADSIITFEVGSSRAAVQAILAATSLDTEEFSHRCVLGAAQIRARAGAWYSAVVKVLTDGSQYLSH